MLRDLGFTCRATRKSSRVVNTRTGRPVRLPQRHRRRTRLGRAAGGLGSTPRRRSWSGNARTEAASTSRRGNPNASASTTTRSRDLRKAIRRRNASPLVGNHGSLPGRRPAAGLRRRRRVHRRPDLGLEDRARRTRRRDRPGDHRLLLSRPGPASGSRSNIGCSPRSPCTNPTTPSIPTTRRDDPTSVGQPLATDNSHSDSLWRTQTNAGRSACHRLTRTRGHLGRVSATRSGAVALSTRFSRWARTGRGTSNCRHC
jgi:hypothetical protein